MRSLLLSLAVMTSLLWAPAALAAPGRAYAPRADVDGRGYEKVALGGRYALYLPRDQGQQGTFAPAKGGHQLLIGYRPSSGPRRLATAELAGRRVYHRGPRSRARSRSRSGSTRRRAWWRTCPRRIRKTRVRASTR